MAGSDPVDASGPLALSPQFFSAVVDAVAHPIFVKDRSFRFVVVNAALCSMVGFGSQEMIGRTDYDFFPKDEADFFRRKDEELFASGGTIAIEEELITDRSGQQHILATTKVPLRDAAGSVTHLVGIIHDITQLKEAETRLLTAKHELEAAVQQRTEELVRAQHRLIRQERLAVLGQLAGGLAHQIRNPLGAISNAAFVLRRALKEYGNPDVTRTVEILLEEVQQANRIVTDLVDYARIRPPMLRPTSVLSLIDDVLKRVPIRSTFKVVRELDALPEVAVDASQVVEAMGNLVANSLEAMGGEGTLTFRGRVDAARVLLSVEDTGTGVPRQIQDRLFEPLVTSKAHGLGLGLTIARSLIENQQGLLTYRARPEGGACFEVDLPAVSDG